MEEPPQFFEQYVNQLKVAKEKLNLDPKIIYYPCCGNDIGPSIVFPKSRIIYVDIQDEVVDNLRKAGYEAYCADAKKFSLEKIIGTKADVIIFFNQAISGLSEIVEKNLTKNGLIICNNYHDAARELKEAGYKLIGVVPEKDPILITDNLDDYASEFENDNELKEKDPIRYRILKRFVDKMKEERKFSKDLSIIDSIKKCIEEYYTELFYFLVENDMVMYPTTILIKKGNPDDVYIFKNS